jgi:hypothetical protein
MADEDDDDDDAFKEVKCGQKFRFNDEAEGEGSGNTEPAARTDGAAGAEREARRAAFKQAANYICEAACPIRRLDLHLAKPQVSTTAAGAGLYTAVSTCAWRCTLTCLPREPHRAEMVEQHQRFECSDDWTIIAEGEATGTAIGEKSTKTVAAAVYASLKKMLDYKIENAIDAFECPTRRCKNKRIHIMLWPRSKIEHGPRVGLAKKTGMKYEWRATQWYRIEVCCED